MLTVEEVGDPEGLAGLGSVWDALAAASGADPTFGSHAWATSWWRHFGQGRRLLVLVVKDGEDPIGLAPWMLRRTGKAWMPVRRIQFLGTGLCDRHDLLLPGRQAEQIDALLDHLERRRGLWDMLDLREIPENSPTIEALRRGAASRRAHLRLLPDSACPFIPIQGDWEAFYASAHGSETRKTNRKKLRRLEREGTLAIRRVEDLRRLPETLGRLSAMPHGETYLGRKRVSLFDDSSRRGFFEDLTTQLAASEALELWVVELSGRLLAYRYGWRSGGTYYDYFADHDPAFNYFSPGTLLLLAVLEDCFARGLREFDFLRGDEPYKLTWTEQRRRHLRMTLFSPSVRGRLWRIGSAFRNP